MGADDEQLNEEVGQTEEQNQTPEVPPTEAAWVAILNALPAEQRVAYDAHVAGLTSALDKERKAAKAASKKVADFEKKEKDAEDARLSELDKTKKALLEAQEATRLATERLTKERAQSAIRMAATTMKFNDPNDAVTWISIEELEWDEEKGKYTNLEARLKALVTSKPYLVTNDTKPGGMPPRSNSKQQADKTRTPTPTVSF